MQWDRAAYGRLPERGGDATMSDRTTHRRKARNQKRAEMHVIREAARRQREYPFEGLDLRRRSMREAT